MTVLVALAWLMGLLQAFTIAWLLLERHERKEQLRSIQAHARDLEAWQRTIHAQSTRLDEHHRDITQLFADTNTQRRKAKP